MASGVFVLYRGDDRDAEPIGTAFAISPSLMLTACHNVVVNDNMLVTELKVTPAIIKQDGKFATKDSQLGRPVDVHKYNVGVDWACLKLGDNAPPFPFVIPVATSNSDFPEFATTEKLFIYHCPVQLFTDDDDIEVCHVMVKEASVGLISGKHLNFQNGAFPGSCGGPYIFRNKAVALHADSVSTAKTAEGLQNETKIDAQSGKKRKLNEEEITRMVADSCASSHASLGSGIILHVRSEIMKLVEKQTSENDMDDDENGNNNAVMGK